MFVALPLQTAWIYISYALHLFTKTMSLHIEQEMIS